MGEAVNETLVCPGAAAGPNDAVGGDRPLGLYRLAVLWAVAAAGAYCTDLPVAQFCVQEGVPGTLRKFFDLSEVFGHGLGVPLIVLAVLVLDPGSPRRLVRLLVCSLGAGLVCDLVKMSLGRTRPVEFSFEGDVWSSFLGWFPAATAGGFEKAFDSSMQSFPSAHTATAVGLAAALTHLYPRGRRLFALLALLVALQRITSGAHYVSDVLAGAALASAWAALWTDPRAWGRWFEKWEQTESLSSNLSGDLRSAVSAGSETRAEHSLGISS